ncbi:hypothetical protein IM816_14895 [Luteibacter flocculans]|uniref:Hemolysin n=1 Tax=Luteibacter flocculans TaxID=2780091 RepID=A0ABY4T3J4_9GAMM|nr:hypothetical protein [Luteibacter flocculans]URL57885.1 hypothetical protein IM816_14895 [Luteibacter flocculans]
MSAPGLTPTNLGVLRHYANTENRELYWNYLAQLPGNDGYGRLALGVVRHDNMPGKIANLYAQNYAREHNGKVFSEREWDNFGIDLMRRDLAYREQRMGEGETRLALNLPVKQVQDAHDQSFRQLRVDVNAWTPRKLLEAARREGERDAQREQTCATERGEVLPGATLDRIIEAPAERIWSIMLNDQALGLHRGKDTLLGLVAAQDMSLADRAAYARDMGAAYVGALNERPHDSPNVIGRNDHYYMRDRHGEWMEIRHAEPVMGIRHDQLDDVTEPQRRTLEDTRDLRLHRAAAREAFHPDDAGRLVESAHPLTHTKPRATLPRPDDDPLYAAVRHRLPMDISDAKAAEVALKARRIGIHHAQDLGAVDVADDRILCSARYTGKVASIECDSTPPPKDQSIDQARQLDQAFANDLRQQAEHIAMQRQQRSHGMSL